MNFTTIEQSKALIEAGLNPDTADMCYMYTKFDGEPEPQYFASLSKAKKNDIPCWSTGALIDLLPFEICIGGNKNLVYQLRLGKARTEIWIAYESQIADMPGTYIGFNTVIDKCDMTCCLFKMVSWLLKNGFIKKVEQYEKNNV